MRRILTVAICGAIMLGAVNALQTAENRHRAKILRAVGTVPNNSYIYYGAMHPEQFLLDPRYLGEGWYKMAYVSVLDVTKFPYPLALLVMNYVGNPQDPHVMYALGLSTGKYSSRRGGALPVEDDLGYSISPSAMRMIIESRRGTTTKPLINTADVVD